MSARKPASQRRGKAGTTRDFGVIRGGRSERPACPAKLGGLKPLKSTVEAWNRLWASNVAAVLELDSDLQTVVRWAELLDERDRAFRSFRRQRVVAGSMGQPTLSPLWQVVRACDSELRALEDRIGLSPKARLQLGIEFAQAARSLDELNRTIDEEGGDGDDDEATPDEDPRLRVIDV